MATYPGGIVALSTHLTGDTIAAADVNTPNAEITAIETGLISGLAHDLLPLSNITESLGSSGKRWLKVWTQDLDASGTITFPAWTTPTFSAGNFTGNNSMTWTLQAGDVTTYRYDIVGHRMTVAWFLVTTTVAGTPSTQLLITIPASKTATTTIVNTFIYSDNGGTNTVGYATVTAAGTTIALTKLDGSNWTAATNTTGVFGEIVFEIN